MKTEGFRDENSIFIDLVCNKNLEVLQMSTSDYNRPIPQNDESMAVDSSHQLETNFDVLSLLMDENVQAKLKSRVNSILSTNYNLEI